MVSKIYTSNKPLFRAGSRKGMSRKAIEEDNRRQNASTKAEAKNKFQRMTKHQRDSLIELLNSDILLNDWETDFIKKVLQYKQTSEKQREVLRKIFQSL